MEGWCSAAKRAVERLEAEPSATNLAVTTNSPAVVAMAKCIAFGAAEAFANPA